MAMQEQASENSLGRSTVLNSAVTVQNFASHSQEIVNFNAGAFSGKKMLPSIFTIPNDFVFVQLLRFLKHILVFHVPQNICN